MNAHDDSLLSVVEDSGAACVGDDCFPLPSLEFDCDADGVARFDPGVGFDATFTVKQGGKNVFDNAGVNPLSKSPNIASVSSTIVFPKGAIRTKDEIREVKFFLEVG